MFLSVPSAFFYLFRYLFSCIILCLSYVLALFYVSLNSIYCIVVSSLLFSPSIYKSCFVICLQLPPPRLVQAICGWESNVISYFPIFSKICCFVVVVVSVNHSMGEWS